MLNHIVFSTLNCVLLVYSFLSGTPVIKRALHCCFNIQSAKLFFNTNRLLSIITYSIGLIYSMLLSNLFI